MKSYSAIVAENAVSTGANVGSSIGRVSGEIAGIILGAGVGATVGAGVHAYDLLSRQFSRAEVKKINRVANWLGDQLNAGRPVEGEKIRDEFARQFSGYSKNASSARGKQRFAEEQIWFDEHITRLIDRIKDVIVSRNSLGPIPADRIIQKGHDLGGKMASRASFGAKIGAKVLGPTAGAAGYTAGAAVGSVVEISKLIVKVLGLAGEGLMGLMKIQFITQKIADADGQGNLPDENTIRGEFVDQFVNKKGHLSMNKHVAEVQKTTDWFHNNYSKTVHQYYSMKEQGLY